MPATQETVSQNCFCVSPIGKFGYWETEYNGIRINLAPIQGLVDFMHDATRRAVAGVELMAFSRKQLETLLDDTPEKEDVSTLGALEDDPIPLELTVKRQLQKQKHKDFIEVEPWEELEPMPEGEAREMSRQFLDVDGVEVEVCTNGNEKHFVRHNVYWWIDQGQKNPDPKTYDIIKYLKNAVDKLPTIRWSGYRFRFETIVFNEDDVEVESILLPLAMFEDLMKDKSRFSAKYLEEIQSEEYKSEPDDLNTVKIFVWLKSNSLFSLIQTDNNDTNTDNPKADS